MKNLFLLLLAGCGGAPFATEATILSDSGTLPSDEAAVSPGSDASVAGDSAEPDAPITITDAALPIDAAHACEPHCRVFVSSATYTGNLGGPGGADVACAGLASKANLGAHWMAWVSSVAATPITRFITKASTGYFDVSNAQVIKSWNDMLATGLLTDQISVTEMGDVIAQAYVWTGTDNHGKWIGAGEDCAGFTSADVVPVGLVGVTGQADVKWTADIYSHCNSSAHLYCFEQ